jgi:hypothetical protein
VLTKYRLLLAGVDNRSGIEGDKPIATPTYVANSLGDFHVLA